MKALLLIVVLLCGASGSVVAQKKNTIMGDLVVGELTGRDEATREITIKYPGKEGPEIFSGILIEGYKSATADGRPSGLQLKEIMPGMHVRAMYKSGDEKVAGQKKKINKITRLDVLGNDKYFRLRTQLNLNPSTTVAEAEKDELPGSTPLKVYLAITYDGVHRQLVEWVDKWNRKNGDTFGKLQPVSDLEQAEVLIVVARGADTSVVELPISGGYGDRVIQGVWSHGTSYLVVKDGGGLKVLWTEVVSVFRSPEAEVSPKTIELVTGEIEKRMKARVRSSKP